MYLKCQNRCSLGWVSEPWCTQTEMDSLERVEPFYVWQYCVEPAGTPYYGKKCISESHKKGAGSKCVRGCRIGGGNVLHVWHGRAKGGKRYYRIDHF